MVEPHSTRAESWRPCLPTKRMTMAHQRAPSRCTKDGSFQTGYHSRGRGRRGGGNVPLSSRSDANLGVQRVQPIQLRLCAVLARSLAQSSPSPPPLQTFKCAGVVLAVRGWRIRPLLTGGGVADGRGKAGRSLGVCHVAVHSSRLSPYDIGPSGQQGLASREETTRRRNSYTIAPPASWAANMKVTAYDPTSAIPDLAGKVILVTGGERSAVL